jgi:hypothetical protein
LQAKAKKGKKPSSSTLSKAALIFKEMLNTKPKEDAEGEGGGGGGEEDGGGDVSD